MSLKWPSCPPCVFPCDVQAARLAACSSPTAGIPGRSAWTSSRITSRTWAPRPTSWSWTSRAPRSAENWSEFFSFLLDTFQVQHDVPNIWVADHYKATVYLVKKTKWMTSMSMFVWSNVSKYGPHFITRCGPDKFILCNSVECESELDPCGSQECGPQFLWMHR